MDKFEKFALDQIHRRLDAIPAMNALLPMYELGVPQFKNNLKDKFSRAVYGVGESGDPVLADFYFTDSFVRRETESASALGEETVKTANLSVLITNEITDERGLLKLLSEINPVSPLGRFVYTPVSADKTSKQLLLMTGMAFSNIGMTAVVDRVMLETEILLSITEMYYAAIIKNAKPLNLQ